MNETKLNWNDLQLFLAVARAGGLSGAAKLTGKSSPTLLRRMQALEVSTGSDLFRRSARGYDLTEDGEALLAKVVDLEASILPMDRTAEMGGQVTVKISAGSWMTHALCQRASQMVRGSASARLRFISAEHELDIAHREAVIGIRNRRPEQVGLAAQMVGRVRFAGYAVARDVAPWVQVMNKTPSARWVAVQNRDGLSIEVSAARSALDLALSGVARAVLPCFIGDAKPALMRVTDPIEELTHDQWLVTHNEDRYRPEVRDTIDRVRKIVRDLHRRVESGS